MLRVGNKDLGVTCVDKTAQQKRTRWARKKENTVKGWTTAVFKGREEKQEKKASSIPEAREKNFKKEVRAKS